MDIRSGEQRLGYLYDAINKINSPNFLFAIEEVQLKTSKQPSAKILTKYIESEMTKFDIGAFDDRDHGRVTYEDFPLVLFENDDLRMSIRLLPKDPSRREDDGKRSIGIYPAKALWGGNTPYIKSALEKKANRYGKLDKPYLIAINSIGPILALQIDADDAIWGSKWGPENLGDGDVYLPRNGGFFSSKFGSNHSGVSGVLITSVFFENIESPNYWLYKNPWASIPIDFGLMKLSYYHLCEDMRIRQERKLFIADILGGTLDRE